MYGSLFLREQQPEARSVEVEAGHRHRNERYELPLPARQNPEARLRVVLAHQFFEIELSLFVSLLNLSCVFHFCVTHDYSSFCRALWNVTGSPYAFASFLFSAVNKNSEHFF